MLKVNTGTLAAGGPFSVESSQVPNPESPEVLSWVRGAFLHGSPEAAASGRQEEEISRKTLQAVDPA